MFAIEPILQEDFSGDLIDQTFVTSFLIVCLNEHALGITEV